jgi:hypothetical protein
VRGTLVDPPCPDSDGEEERYCQLCEDDTTHYVERWGWYIVVTCEDCGVSHETDARDEYDGPDDRRQEEIERGD